MDQSEKAYWNHEVSKVLGIGDSTLRKWCLALEKNGYEFVKGAKDSRAFLEHDMQALIYFKQLTKTEKYTQDDAALMVAEKYSRTADNGRTIPVPVENNRITTLENAINQLLEQSQRQDEFNRVLLQKLEQQEKYITESIEKRDRLLLESLRTTQEQAAAAREESSMKNRIKRLFRIK